jgi:hypothetical protein
LVETFLYPTLESPRAQVSRKLIIATVIMDKLVTALSGFVHRSCESICPANQVFSQPRDDGAQERTRTFTAVKPLAPEASASTNSTTWARGRLVRIARALVKFASGNPNRLYSADMMAYRESAKYLHDRANFSCRN